MSNPARLGRHPIHPILIVLPIGLWVFSLVCDLVYRFNWGDYSWSRAALYTLGGGIVGALLAAVPGLLDLLTLTDPKVKRIAVWHMVINLVAVVVFAINFGLRLAAEPGATLPFALSALGVALIFVSGWLGGELVYVHGVAVERPAPEARTRP